MVQFTQRFLGNLINFKSFYTLCTCILSRVRRRDFPKKREDEGEGRTFHVTLPSGARGRQRNQSPAVDGQCVHPCNKILQASRIYIGGCLASSTTP
ncbi:hypothetical protein BRADI_1g34331v3 [Brachypodium distachyon]|uniref:Uncharacterized protein n=1 Tax=Brachypodium distachyon TaxID=15368 RepID=A0A2K2DMN7_BRADI|nr:hypothetical protein BRADI_1g34331v3 [Brachypodium distachyon]